MNADKILFRCSSLGHIMTDPRTGTGLSETTKTHLVDLFVSSKYGRNTDIHTRATNKGLMVEEDSLTLYSRYKGEFFKKNEDRFNNEFISGCPDILPKKDNIVRDIKSSWDIYTFFRNILGKINKMYYWQIQGYCDLTGADSGVLAYCLINTPEILVHDEKRRLQFKMGVIDDANLDFQAACEGLDKLLVYDDIQINERVIELHIPRNDEDIKRMHKRVLDCREYMNVHLFKNKVATF